MPQHLDAAMSAHSSPHSGSASRYSKNLLWCRIPRLSPHSCSLEARKTGERGEKASQTVSDISHIRAKFRPVIQNRLLCSPVVHKQSIQPISGQFLPEFLTGVSRDKKGFLVRKPKFWQTDCF